jgi:hypothetical protein
MLWQIGLCLYEGFHKEDGTEEETSPFTTGKVWLHRFGNRFNLKNFKIIEQATSGDEEAAATFQNGLKIIKEGNYDPRHVFNRDETGLFWKKIRNLTFIHKSAKESSVLKAWTDRLTLVLCGNAAGPMNKHGFVYRAKNPRALKNKIKFSTRLLAT